MTEHEHLKLSIEDLRADNREIFGELRKISLGLAESNANVAVVLQRMSTAEKNVDKVSTHVEAMKDEQRRLGWGIVGTVATMATGFLSTWFWKSH